MCRERRSWKIVGGIVCHLVKLHEFPADFHQWANGRRVVVVVRMIEETRVSVHARTYVQLNSEATLEPVLHLAESVRNLSLQRQVPGD